MTDIPKDIANQPITIKDVAAASGVSRATVSQVLGNGQRHVNPQTRERILKVASDLKYQPSAVARGLTKRRMNTIGLAFPHWPGDRNPNIYLMTLLDGVLNVCVQREQMASLCTFPDWGAAENTLALTDGRCDGILVLVPPADPPLLDVLQQRGIPLVLVNGHDPSGRIASVDVDNIAAARQITHYLLDLGHRRIAFYSRDFDAAFPYLPERREGYLQAMAAAGLSDNIQFLTDQDEEILGYTAGGRPTAVVCVFDILALGLMERLGERGVRVPEDVSIVGFDDVPTAVGSRPPLTTVRQPVTQIGARAVELLLAQIDGTEPVRQEYLPTELIVRQSAAPPS